MSKVPNVFTKTEKIILIIALAAGLIVFSTVFAGAQTINVNKEQPQSLFMINYWARANTLAIGGKVGYIAPNKHIGGYIGYTRLAALQVSPTIPNTLRGNGVVTGAIVNTDYAYAYSGLSIMGTEKETAPLAPVEQNVYIAWETGVMFKVFDNFGFGFQIGTTSISYASVTFFLTLN